MIKKRIHHHYYNRGRRGRDCIVIRFSTTCVITTNVMAIPHIKSLITKLVGNPG